MDWYQAYIGATKKITERTTTDGSMCGKISILYLLTVPAGELKRNCDISRTGSTKLQFKRRGVTAKNLDGLLSVAMENGETRKKSLSGGRLVRHYEGTTR